MLDNFCFILMCDRFKNIYIKLRDRPRPRRRPKSTPRPPSAPIGIGQNLKSHSSASASAKKAPLGLGLGKNPTLTAGDPKGPLSGATFWLDFEDPDSYLWGRPSLGPKKLLMVNKAQNEDLFTQIDR